VNECNEGLDSCERSVEECRNTAGAYECDTKCQNGYRYDTRLRTCQGTLSLLISLVKSN
jgi:hypothetical protein